MVKTRAVSKSRLISIQRLLHRALMWSEKRQVKRIIQSWTKKKRICTLLCSWSISTTSEPRLESASCNNLSGAFWGDNMCFRRDTDMKELERRNLMLWPKVRLWNGFLEWKKELRVRKNKKIYSELNRKIAANCVLVRIYYKSVNLQKKLVFVLI